MATVTPNKIKTTTSPEPDTITVGNFKIGTSSGGAYAPTSSTGFWQSITPPVGGYTVCEGTGTAIPSLHTPQDDSGLIWYANYLGAGGLTTIEEALSYFAISSTHRCVNIDYPDIVTSGLTSLHDFGYVPSCVRAGSIVYDIGPNGNNASISFPIPVDPTPNPFIFSGSSGELTYMDFGPSYGDDYFQTVGGNDQEFTVCMLVNFPISPSGARYPIELVNGNSYVSKIRIDKYATFYVGDDLIETSMLIPRDTWVSVAASYSSSTGKLRFYTDGFQRQVGTGTSIGSNTSFGVTVGQWPQEFQPSGAMSMMNVMTYSRELTQDEIALNFSAYASRYGLREINYAMNGIRMCMDASDPRSGEFGSWKDLAYEIPSVKMFNMSGFSYNESTNGGIFTSTFYYSSSNSIISYDLTLGFTVELMVQLALFAGSSPSIFCQFPSIYNESNFIIYYDTLDFKVKAKVQDGSSSQVLDSGVIGGLNWKHIVYTYDGAEYSLYVNAVLVARQTATLTPPNSGEPYQIGGSFDRSASPGTQGVDMNLSVIRLYERALTEQEIRRNYNDALNRIS